MNKDIKLETYKEYIRQCTSAANSADNYSDFKRLNKIIKNRYSDFTELLDCDNPDYLQNIYDELCKLDSFYEFNGTTNDGKNFKKLGGGQYHNALIYYITFLRAVRLLANHEYTNTLDTNSLDTSIYPLQQIFYGAPGTGKSNTIKCEVDDKNKIRYRTTFHPDSDYSTFVGCYKPTMKNQYRYDERMKPKYYEDGDLFGAKEDEIIIDKVIHYDFVPQAFTKAYVKAWQNPEYPVFLIIEEINRGNCAQIFGDIFQLLDRNDQGFSDYPIKADDDLKAHLHECFASYDNLPDNIKSGEELQLPSNLYIWATMNTSDQSLFPIDSAFKRRWDWQYVPIYDANKGWKIEVSGKKYGWWSFLEKINEKIASTTSSEDKKLGYFFCKADDNGIISVEKFVGKVIFYLWNDVFKDYAEECGVFVDEANKAITFDKFYVADSSGRATVATNTVEIFLKKLGVEAVNEANLGIEIKETSIE